MSFKDQLKLVALVTCISLGMVLDHMSKHAAENRAGLQGPEQVWQQPLVMFRSI
ncbi:MAG: hypothetical protein GJ676_05220 [Rhodobacteraceae bacterium]|nr:hypothetical protein [Paracoccaceae bacterium]